MDRQADRHADRQTDRQTGRPYWIVEYRLFSLQGPLALEICLGNVLDFENTIAISSLSFM